MKYNQDYFNKHNSLNRYMAEYLVNFTKKQNLKNILDVGCGTGKLVHYLNNHKLNAIGCDNSQLAVSLARKINKKGTIVESSASKLKFKDQSFDLVTAISIIEHLNTKEAKQFLKESARVLKKNGFIFLVTPNYLSPARILLGKKWFAYQDPTHINFFTPERLSKLLSRNGFSSLKTHFPINYHPKLDKEFPHFFKAFPVILKVSLIYLLFDTPLYIIRDSFWMAAQNK